MSDESDKYSKRSEVQNDFSEVHQAKEGDPFYVTQLDDLSSESAAVNLRKIFPLSARGPFRECFYWFAAYAFMLLLYGISQYLLRDGSAIGGDGLFIVYWNLLARAFNVLTAIIAVKLIYEIIYHYKYGYGILDSHVVVNKGVFIKSKGSFHLQSVTDVFIERNVAGFVFGVYDVVISSPSSEAVDDLETNSSRLVVAGLSNQNAVDFQDYMRALIRDTRPVIREIDNKAKAIAQNFVDSHSAKPE